MVDYGVFIGNDPKELALYEDWLGRDVDFVRIYGGKANWTDHLGSLGWLGNRFKSLDVPMYWSVPLIVSGATLAEGAKGTYDKNFIAAAKAILSVSPSEGTIYIRTGEEFNGGWFPWAAKGKEGDYIATFRHFVDAFRSLSDRFVFEWNVNIGDLGMDPAKAYPGDAYVDFIGMDFYYNTQWDPTDPVKAWNYMVSRKYGLQWLEDFADSRGKPTAYSEWGLNNANAAAYVDAALKWFEDHDAAYQSYWDSNAAFPGKLSNTVTSTSEAFRAGLALPVETIMEALPDIYDVTSGSHQVVTAPAGILANDSVGVEALSLVSGASHGSLRLQADGGFTYVPDLGFTGADGFVYLPAAATGPFGGAIAVSLNVAGPAVGEPPVSGAATRTITGTGGNDRLAGTAGNDSIVGGIGGDIMTGGKGDDTYEVDREGDVVIELAGEGIDTIRNYLYAAVMPENVENLVLLRTGGQNATGNALANRITGNSYVNAIEGAGGNDWLTGGGGKDTYLFSWGSGHDVITDFTPGYGTEADRILLRGMGLDFATLMAGTTDTTRGALIALPDGGSLLLLGLKKSALLAANFVFAGPVAPKMSAGVPGAWHFGTAAAEVINGTTGNDLLDGNGGGDLLIGGGGDDQYVVHQPGDTVVELGGGGIDLVRSWASAFVLPDQVEHLILASPDGQAGTGNALANRIIGGAGADVIDGKGGNDWLVGRGGSDRFVFDAKSGHDVIADFAAGAGGDVLDLAGAGFRSLAAVRDALTVVENGVTLKLGAQASVWLPGVGLDALTAANLFLDAGRPAEPALGAKTTRWIGGTSGPDTIYGDDRNDNIYSGNGIDTLIGGKGDDLYSVENSRDVVIEKPGEGIDTVESYASTYELSANVEHLILNASFAQTGIGNGLANRITGSAQANRIDGRGGDDWLTGKGGADTFVVGLGHGSDVITDFKPTAEGDRIDLSAFRLSFASLRDRMTEWHRPEGTDVTIELGEDQVLSLFNVELASLQASHFLL